MVCTHNLDEAERLCDRIGIMRGTLLRVDTPAGLRRHGRGATVRVELNGARGPESFLGRLADLAYVRGAQAHDGALVVELDDPPHETPDLVAELVGAGARITGVGEDAADAGGGLPRSWSARPASGTSARYPMRRLRMRLAWSGPSSSRSGATC